jgi:hypothetical protein
MVVFRSFRNTLSRIIKFCRSITILTIFKIFATIIFTHQTILLSIDYLKYEAIIDLKLNRYSTRDYDSNPSISLCLKPMRFYLEKNRSSTIKDQIGLLERKFFRGMKIVFLIILRKSITPY